MLIIIYSAPPPTSNANNTPPMAMPPQDLIPPPPNTFGDTIVASNPFDDTPPSIQHSHQNGGKFHCKSFSNFIIVSKHR